MIYILHLVYVCIMQYVVCDAFIKDIVSKLNMPKLVIVAMETLKANQISNKLQDPTKYKIYFREHLSFWGDISEITIARCACPSVNQKIKKRRRRRGSRGRTL